MIYLRHKKDVPYLVCEFIAPNIDIESNFRENNLLTNHYILYHCSELNSLNLTMKHKNTSTQSNEILSY